MILRRRYVLPMLFIMLWVGFRNCRVLELRMSDKDIQETLTPLNYPYHIMRQNVAGRQMRYIKVGYDSLPPLIFLHGSPSSLSAWRPIYTDTAFLKRYQVISIDRPGYGYSGYGSIETGIRPQANTIIPIIDSVTRGRKAILVGSSYGGPVAARIAMDRRDLVSQLVLLSASVKPGSETTYWVSYPMTTPILEYLFPPTFVMSSKEKLAHKKELETLNQWSNINTDVLIIHGDKDGLVYYDNAAYARQQLANARSVITVTMKGKGHSIIFSEPGYIRSLLLHYLH